MTEKSIKILYIYGHKRARLIGSCSAVFIHMQSGDSINCYECCGSRWLASALALMPVFSFCPLPTNDNKLQIERKLIAGILLRTPEGRQACAENYQLAAATKYCVCI